MPKLEDLLRPYQDAGIRLGLEGIRDLLGELDNPQQHVPVIHVAGTNGKGSVCAYLSSILAAAGYQVGRYTSPHLVSWTERICLQNQPVLESDLIEVLAAVIATKSAARATQFELLTAAAWLYFARQEVDVAVIEVGLGGRLDATNVCNSPLVAVITSIDYDHCQVLGSTLGEIAAEKAGILKPGCPLVLGPLPAPAEAVCSQRARELGCRILRPTPAQEISPGWAKVSLFPGLTYPLVLAGEVQLVNSALALGGIKVLQEQGWQVTEEAIQTGMAKTSWPGRLQWSSWRGCKILVDGAHNPGAALALRQHVDRFQQPIHWVFGALVTKDYRHMLRTLLRPRDSFFAVPVPSHSCVKPEVLAGEAQDLCELKSVQAWESLGPALDQAVINSPLVVVAGSLYLVGELFRLQTGQSR